MQYAPLHFNDKPREREAAMAVRMGKSIYVYGVYDSLEEAEKHNLECKPIGILEKVFQVREQPYRLWTGTLVKVQY